MKVTLLLFLIFCHLTATGQTRIEEISDLEKSLNSIQSKQVEIDKKLRQLSIASIKNNIDIQSLCQHNDVLYRKIDSLKIVCDSLQKAQVADRTTINCQIKETNSTLVSTQSIVKNRTFWGGVISAIILFSLFIISYYLTKRIKRGTSSINEIRKVQDALQKAHIKMQEESVKLDNKMIELCEQQIRSTPTKIESKQTDHSLALKVADEIVRIELNLSRMDASVKGYKQLSKAVERIKNNFQANGYEIIDMLGKPYSEGMKVVANFVPDETLKEGEQIISGVTKPQINYNGKMIQSAQITVSQNI